MREFALSLSRRRILQLGASLPLALRLGVAGSLGLALTPERADADETPTPNSAEGPYFKPRSPERASLRESSVAGDPLVVTGRVLGTDGKPVAKALLDFWQADGDGQYDLAGFRCRGHQFTSAEGTYRLETVVPDYYPGRTRHLHVKVQAPSKSVLTTQLFFPNDPRNRRDGLYTTWLRMKVVESEGVKNGSFDFVVAVAT